MNRNISPARSFTSAAGWKDFKMEQSWNLIREGLFDYPLVEGQEPALRANRCTKCGKTFFPKRSLCPHCFEEGELEDIILENKGIIYACTVVYINSPVGIEAPYAYGYVEIPKNKVRIFALFTGSDPLSFRVGQQVELAVEPIRENDEGQQVIGFKFKSI